MIPGEGRSYSSRFTFAEGYSINVERHSGDTAQSSFALLDEDDILLKESAIFIRSGYKQVERQYYLTIGDVEIRRSTSVDSIQVYLDGVLQQHAAVKITDFRDGEKSICHSRDLEITFDHGTKTRLSELINPARETLRTLMSSMDEMYFAKYIVDYIAISIAFNTR